MSAAKARTAITLARRRVESAPVSAPMQEFEQLYRECAPIVYRTAKGVLGSREDAEDVVQSVFMALVGRESPPLLENPKAYFYKAAMLASLNVLRAKRRRPALVDDAALLQIPVPAPSSLFDEELYERLMVAVRALSPDAAAVLLLRYAHNKSLAAIAAELGLSRTVVAVRLFRARARLRARLNVSSEKQQ
jgi:RNA polymerase sigma-70 factor (ECF subfamily)